VPVALGVVTARGVTERAGVSVLTATDGDLVQEVRGADGSADLRLGTGATARRVGVAGDGTLWRADNEAGAALALSPLGDGSFEARTFRRGATGWAAAGWLGRSGTLFGCVGARGRQVVVSDPAPVLLDVRTGTRTPVPRLAAGGDCGFTAGGVVVAQYALAGSGQRTVLVAAGLDGREHWHGTYASEVGVRTDIGGRGWLAVFDGRVEERDADGERLGTIHDVTDARYTQSGDIVVVDDGGRVRWVPGKGRTPH
jgi:hypothetical protein